MKNNNMKLIMENWRKFSSELESVDKSKVLIETKTFSGNLQNLLQEHQRRSISQNQFKKIIIESIEKETEELNKILFEYSKIKSSKLITEAEADEKKQSLFKAAIEKIKNIAIKTKEVIDTAFMQPIFLKNNIENALKQFGKENPKTAQALKTAGKIAVFAGLGMALAHYLDGSSAMASDLVNMSDIKDLENYRTYLAPDSMDGSNFWDWVGRHANDFQGADKLTGEEIRSLKTQTNISPNALVKILKYIKKYLSENTIQGIDSGNPNLDSLLDASADMSKKTIAKIDATAAKAAGFTRDADFNLVPTGDTASSAADAATSAVSQAADAATQAKGYIGQLADAARNNEVVKSLYDQFKPDINDPVAMKTFARRIVKATLKAQDMAKYAGGTLKDASTNNTINPSMIEDRLAILAVKTIKALGLAK